jgi:Tol biopolymer transport system component
MKTRTGRSAAVAIMFALAVCTWGPEVAEAPAASASAPTPVETDDSVPPEGEVLGFTGEPGPGDLVAVDPSTGDTRVLLSDLADVNSAWWSADRRWVAYVDDAGSWVVGPEQESRPLTSGSQPLWSWSPTGARIAIIDGSRLSILDVDSESTTELARVTGDVTSPPVWSPDGTRLAYGARGGKLVSVDVESGEPSVVAELPGHDLDSMDEIEWSPDEARFAIFNDTEPGLGRLYLVNADGSDVRVLLDDVDFAGMAWSPDGARLAYLDYFGTGLRIFTQAPDGDAPILLGFADAGSCVLGCGGPVWSPDGSRIGLRGGAEYVAGDGAWMFFAVDADGTGTVEPIDRMTFASWNDGSYFCDCFGF